MKSSRRELLIGGSGALVATAPGLGHPSRLFANLLGKPSVPIFAAAINIEVELYYVEQEPPFTTMPAMEAIKIDYDYLHAMA